MAISLIRNFIAKQIMKKSKGITSVIPDAKEVTFAADHLEKRLINMGVDLKSIKSEEQLKQILAYVKQAEDQAFAKRFKDVLKPKADVLDLTGKKIDTSRPIMGGKNVPETEAEIAARLTKQNKEAIERLRNKEGPIDWDEVDKIDPEDFAYGGLAGMLGEPTYADEDHRVPYKDGTKFNPKRRTILKGLGALAALPVVGKFFKFVKPLAKTSKVADLTSVPIGSAEGMPAWFKPLVNKVIREGESADSWATGVKSVVHKTKLPNSKTTVVVEQQLDTGDVIVDIGVGKHGFADGHHGQPVRLQYKAKELIEPDIDDAGKIKSQGKEVPEEFWVEEAEFTGGHPENIKFEESTIEKFGDHGSNFDEVEKFATGKVKKTKPTKKAERTEYESGKAEADAERVTDEAREDVDFDDLSSDDFAEGGRVPLSGGGLINLAKLMKLFPKIHKDSLLEASRITDSKKLQKMLKSFRKTEEAIDKSPSVELFDLDVKGRKPNATGGRVSLSAGGIAGMLGE